eukprot:GHVR01013118.1.p1 GENE.GHVR01013118.1~~GHVR01013118.1.p1  ORF type:complete len:298 (-),score=58.31 GHVR01013118.1:176-1069(-)
MSSRKALSLSDRYIEFKARNPLHKISLPRSENVFTYYELGPTKDTPPLIFIHGLHGTAGVFFQQMEHLSSRGIRVISCQYPPLYTIKEWCKAFQRFLEIINVDEFHVFGAGLGGFLAQCFSQQKSLKMKSLILCNSYCSTFSDNIIPMVYPLRFLPHFTLKAFIIECFPKPPLPEAIHESFRFTLECIDSLDAKDLSSRLTLCMTRSFGNSGVMNRGGLMILTSLTPTLVPPEAIKELHMRYPEARIGQIKGGGDFPFLSSPHDVNIFIEVHLRSQGVFPIYIHTHTHTHTHKFARE